MEELILRGALKEGFFAVLFISILIYQLKENRSNQDKAEKREEKLTRFLDAMKQEFASLVRQYERLSDDMEEIKDKIDRK